MWYKIRKKQPKEDVPVLFHTPEKWYGEGYHVGYWSEYENAMLETNDGSDCIKWAVDKWMYIPKD